MLAFKSLAHPVRPLIQHRFIICTKTEQHLPPQLAVFDTGIRIFTDLCQLHRFLGIHILTIRQVVIAFCAFSDILSLAGHVPPKCLCMFQVKLHDRIDRIVIFLYLIDHCIRTGSFH